MKKLLFIISTILIISCKPYTAPEANLPIQTFVVIQTERQDTIKADSYQFGNYIGLGRAFIFYIGEQKVGTIITPENNKLLIKVIHSSIDK